VLRLAASLKREATSQVKEIVLGFRDLLLRGNLLELAVALVMALAFTRLVQAFITDLITPIIAMIVGEPSFEGLSFTINDAEFLYGAFINELIIFASTGAAIYFFIVVPMKRWMGTDKRECPECLSEVPRAARRCSFCTTTLTPAA
jgi:large conductance mechanosensitive channel